MEDGLPRFPIEKYQISEVLGHGAYGIVNLYRLQLPYYNEDWEYSRTNTKLPKEVAVKVFGHKYESTYNRENENMKIAMNHPNIVWCYGFCELKRPGLQGLVMEAFDSDLMQYVEIPQTLQKTRDILRQIASALRHLRRKNLVHRDVKPENILVRVTEARGIEVRADYTHRSVFLDIIVY